MRAYRPSACVPFLRQGANASANGTRAMLVLFNEPRYNQLPYSRAVVMGE